MCFLPISLYNCRPGSTSSTAANNSVPSGNSSMKRNGGINANSSSIHNATKKGNTGPAGEQNASETAKKANPKAVLANEKKAATQLGVIVGMSKIPLVLHIHTVRSRNNEGPPLKFINLQIQVNKCEIAPYFFY